MEMTITKEPWEFPYMGRTGCCDIAVHLMPAKEPTRAVIIISEPVKRAKGYHLVSVTNAIEEIATTMKNSSMFKHIRSSAIVWIEHYPDRDGEVKRDETWDLVQLCCKGTSRMTDDVQMFEPTWWRIQDFEAFKKAMGWSW